jgi:hypothetical protein
MGEICSTNWEENKFLKDIAAEMWKGRERLGGIGVDKLTLGWILSTLCECVLDSSGTRVDGGEFFRKW